MKAITFAALCVAVISADRSSVSSYSSSPSNVRDFEYNSGGSYLAGKHSYGDLSSAAAYIAGGSPYAKSDTRYSSDGSGDSNDPRGSLTSSFYKTKYGNEAVANAIRPSPFHTSSSSGSSSSGSSPSSSSSSSEVSSSQGGSHYSTGDNPSSAYSSSSGSSPYYESSSGGSGSSSPSEYTASASYSTSYGDRSPAYSTTGDAGSSGGHGEYVAAGRPGGLVYGGYSAGSGLSEYQQTRPSYGHSSVGSPASSSLSSSDYMHLSSAVHGHPPHPHHHHHHHHHSSGSYPMSEDYSPHIQSQPSHGYKTYVTSPSSYPSKSYSSVFGALKSLFGGGMLSDPAPSATHLSSYPSAPSGPGPMYSSSMMHAAHHGPSAPSMGPAGPGYYFSTGGPGSSGSPYSKSYAPMRLVSGYGGSGNSGSKIIVVRDSSSGHGSPYPSGAAGILGSPSGYVAKSKISAFSPSPQAPSYLSASPSSLSYSASAPPSSAYPGSYSSSGSFPGGHGGSTFLGYSA